MLDGELGGTDPPLTQRLLLLSVLVSIAILTCIGHATVAFDRSSLRADNRQSSYFREDEEFLYLGNNWIEVGFYRDDGGLRSIVHKESKIDLMNSSSVPHAILWAIALYTEDKQDLGFSSHFSRDFFNYSWKKLTNGTELCFEWENIEGKETYPDVTVKVTMYDDSPLSSWHIQIENKGDFAIIGVEFPEITGINWLGSNPSDDFLVIPSTEGHLYHDAYRLRVHNFFGISREIII